MPNYHIYEDSKFKNYYPLPAEVLRAGLSSTAIILYSVLLGKTSLSQKNHWVDEEGRVFVRIAYSSLADEIHKSHSTVKVCLRELEDKKLIKRKLVKGDIHIIYALYPHVTSPRNTWQADNNPRGWQNTDYDYGRKQPTNKYSEYKKYNYDEGAFL